MADIDRAALAGAYLEHLTDRDAELLLATEPDTNRELRVGANGESRRRLADPSRLERLLASPATFEVVFNQVAPESPLVVLSPFLVFAVAVHRAAAELASVSYVSEWLGPRRRAPVFDTPSLREFLASPARRLFLAELLASYTRVVSGSVLVATPRGQRRQRFSELDPVRFAALLDVVPPAERPGVLRRLGDLALFLTGVFPDQVALRGFGPVEEHRLLRSGREYAPATSAGPRAPDLSGIENPGAVGLLEQLGRRWYRAAAELVPDPQPAAMAVIGELPSRFGEARRVLNFVTDRFLFRRREVWFGFGG